MRRLTNVPRVVYSYVDHENSRTFNMQWCGQNGANGVRPNCFPYNSKATYKTVQMSFLGEGGNRVTVSLYIIARIAHLIYFR